MGEGVDEIAVGVLCQPLQGHRTACGIAEQALQLIPPMRRNLGLSVERKAVHTGTPRTGEPGRFALRAKARADAAHVLSGSFSTRDALLDRSRHGAGELRGGVSSEII